jgi:hypothetical protein
MDGWEGHDFIFYTLVRHAFRRKWHRVKPGSKAVFAQQSCAQVKRMLNAPNEKSLRNTWQFVYTQYSLTKNINSLTNAYKMVIFKLLITKQQIKN